jgi:glycosyltransferase involved in cell wall biosynthesis
MNNKILFIGFDDFSHINAPVIQQLTQHFSKFQIRKVWLKPQLKKQKVTLAIAFGAMLWELGADFLNGDKKWRKWRNHFYSTGYMMRALSKIAKKETEKEPYIFTFQTQSLFKCPGGRFGHFIYTDHTNLNNLNYQLVNHQEYLASKSFRLKEREIYREAASIFVMSENIRRSLIDQYGISPKKAHLVFAGANTGESVKTSSEKFRRRNIVFAGKDWDRKGGPLLLEAFKKIREQIPDATLTILGCNPKTLQEGIQIKGEVPKSEVIGAFQESTVFCLPTKREPFGMVFIEAMFNRLPVVCTACGATPDLIEEGKNGFLVPFQSDALAEKLILLLTQPELAEQFADEGYRKACTIYTWDNVGQRMANVIRKQMVQQ